MRTFKQFKVGEINYTLSFDRFTSMHEKSIFTAFLRIVGNECEFHLEVIDMYYWKVYAKGRYVARIEDSNKAQEVRRLIMLFLINQL